MTTVVIAYGDKNEFSVKGGILQSVVSEPGLIHVRFSIDARFHPSDEQSEQSLEAEHAKHQ